MIRSEFSLKGRAEEYLDHITTLTNTLNMTHLWLQAKKSSDDPRKALPESQTQPVSGLFGSPTFDSGAAGTSVSKPNTLLDGKARDKDEAATLAQIQYVHHKSPLIVQLAEMLSSQVPSFLGTLLSYYGMQLSPDCSHHLLGI